MATVRLWTIEEGCLKKGISREDLKKYFRGSLGGRELTELIKAEVNGKLLEKPQQPDKPMGALILIKGVTTKTHDPPVVVGGEVLKTIYTAIDPECTTSFTYRHYILIPEEGSVDFKTVNRQWEITVGRRGMVGIRNALKARQGKRNQLAKARVEPKVRHWF